MKIPNTSFLLIYSCFEVITVFHQNKKNSNLIDYLSRSELIVSRNYDNIYLSNKVATEKIFYHFETLIHIFTCNLKSDFDSYQHRQNFFAELMPRLIFLKLNPFRQPDKYLNRYSCRSQNRLVVAFVSFAVLNQRYPTKHFANWENRRSLIVKRYF